VTSEELGKYTLSTKSGVAHITSANDVECLEDLKQLLSYLPQSNKETAQKLDYELNDEIREQLAYHPDNPNKPMICIRLLLELLMRLILST
jgi:propionyl-CoA carboxylase beta chain